MKCPGQDMQYWTSEAIFDVECPECHKMVEFYKDDTTRKCNHCGHRFVNPNMDFGCATYCQFAEQCLGTLPEEFAGARDNLFKDKVAVEIKRYWGTDFKKIRRTLTAAKYAEDLGKRSGANMAVVLCSAYVYDINKTDAKTVLEKAGATPQMVNEIFSVLNEITETRDKEPSLEGKLVHDALLLRSAHEQIREDQTEPETAAKELQQTLSTNWSRELLQATDWHN